METSKLVISDNTYVVKDTKLRDDYNTQKKKFDDIAEEARDIGVTVTKGKEAVADAITTKGVPTEPDAKFDTMANNVLAISSSSPTPTPGTSGFEYTPPSNAYTATAPGEDFICDFPYRKYTKTREAGTDMQLVVMPVNYRIVFKDTVSLSIVSRVKRLTDSWSGVYVVGNKGLYNENAFLIQFLSNTELAYKHGNTATSWREITIPDVSSWEEMIVEFKFNQYVEDDYNTMDTSIHLAKVENNKIQEFTEVHSERVLNYLYWVFNTNAENSLVYLGSKYTQQEVTPSACNMFDCAFVVNGEIWAGNTSLYPFPEDFTIY